MEKKTLYILDTNIHLDCITTALLSSKINFYSMVGKSKCRLGITPVTKDEILRNLPKVIEKNVNYYKEQLKTATNCLHNVRAHVDRLDKNADTILEKCISLTEKHKKLDIEHKVAKKFCFDSVCNASYTINLVDDSAIENIINKAEERVKYNRLPATSKRYDLGDCIYWESIMLAAKAYSDIVFSTKDNAFIHNEQLHPHLRDELPVGLSFRFFKDSIELTKHVRDKLPQGKKKYPDDLISSASTSVSTSLTSIPQPFSIPNFKYFYKRRTCPACGHRFTPDSQIPSSKGAYIVCPKCANDFYVSD